MAKILMICLTFVLWKTNTHGQIIYSLPITYSNYQLIFTDIYINGVKVKALFDTGNFSEFRISSTLAQKMNLLSSTIQSSTTLDNKKRPVSIVIIDSISLGNLKLNNINVDCIENYIEGIEKRISTPIDIIIGWPFFEKYFCEFDIKNSTFRFSNNMFWSKSHKNKFHYNIVDKAPIITVKIDSSTANLLFDTGAPFCKLDSSFNATLSTNYTEKEIQFLSYKIPFIIRSFKVNKKSYKVEFSISNTKATKCQGIIGNNFLSNYKFYINPLERTIEF